MNKYTVINHQDGNDTFEVEGNTDGDAAIIALQQLGWRISIKFDSSDHDDDYKMEHYYDPEEKAQMSRGYRRDDDY